MKNSLDQQVATMSLCETEQHEYGIAKKSLTNCRHLLYENTGQNTAEICLLNASSHSPRITGIKVELAFTPNTNNTNPSQIFILKIHNLFHT